MALLDVRGAHVMLGEVPVVQGLDLSVDGGEMVGLIGPNGAGKTTALRALLRLLPLTNGRVLLDGDDITHAKPHTLAGRMAYLPQGQTAHWPLTARRLVALGRLPHLNPWQQMTEADQTAIDKAIAAADIAHLIDRPVTALSGGERARVLLARALCVEAPVLLVDEPVVSLDPQHQLSVMEALKAHAVAGGAVLAVLHDLELAARFCDRLVLMQQGRVVADGSPADVLTNDHLERVYHVRRDQDGTLQRI